MSRDITSKSTKNTSVAPILCNEDYGHLGTERKKEKPNSVDTHVRLRSASMVVKDKFTPSANKNLIVRASGRITTDPISNYFVTTSTDTSNNTKTTTNECQPSLGTVHVIGCYRKDGTYVRPHNLILLHIISNLNTTSHTYNCKFRLLSNIS